MLEKPKKRYFTHIKGTNIRNIFPLLMFQQLLVNKHHRLRDSNSRTRFGRSHRRKLRHSNSGREKFGSAYREKQEDLLDLITALKKKLKCIFKDHCRNALHIPKQPLMIH